MTAAVFVSDVRVPQRDLDERVDVLVEDGSIVAIEPTGRGPAPKTAEVIEGLGHWLLPGFIDDHVHLREPGLEHKEGFFTGSRAAAAGGITTMLEIQNNQPLMVDRAAVLAKLEQVRPKSVVNVGVYGSLVPPAMGQLAGMSDLVKGYKLFMGPSTGGLDVQGDERLRAMFTEVAQTGQWLFVHAEDGQAIAAGLAAHDGGSGETWHLARSTEAEVIATEQALALGAECGTRVHIFHVSSGAAVDRVTEARHEGRPVGCGTCPHYLYFTWEDTARVGPLLRVNPSIKTAADTERLIEGLRSGEVDCLSSDHAPHTAEEKTRPFAKAMSGIPSLDIFMPLCLTLVDRGLLTLEQVLDRGARTPAEVHGYSRKGLVAVGNDADLVLVDPDERRAVVGAEHFSKARLTPYEGMELWGWPRRTLVMGNTVHQR